MKKKVINLLSFMLISILVFAGCSNGMQSSNKILKVAIEKTFNTLNHHTSDMAAESEVINQFMEGLFRFDENQNLIPAGAESYEKSEDGSVYTFKLRKEAKWSDGTPVTAHDYEYAWKTGVTNKKTAGKANLFVIKNAKAISNDELPISELGAEAIDDYTFKVTLEIPNATFINLLIYNKFLPLSEKNYEALGGEEGYGQSPETLLTNGPFKLTEYVAGSKIVLAKNLEYWDSKSVQLDGAEISVIQELATQNVMFEKNELDMLRVQGELSDIYNNKEELLSSLESRMLFMYLSKDISGNEDILKSKNMRAAIAHAIDKETIASNVVKGGAVPLNGLIVQNFYKVDGKDYREESGQFQEGIFDKQKAQEYLAKAKEELGKEEIAFTFMVQDLVLYKKTFENIKAQIEEALPGVTMNLETLPNQVYFKEIMKKTTTAGMGTWSADYTDLHNFTQIFEVENSFNFADYLNPEYEALVTAAQLEQDVKQQATIYAQAEKVILEDYVFIPVYQQGLQYKLKDNIKGVHVNPVVPIIDFKYISKN